MLPKTQQEILIHLKNFNKNETTEADTTSDSTVTPEETTLAEIDDDSYEFVDETVSNPTVAPIEIQEPDETDSSANITEKDLTGTWKPLIATSVADSKEVPFQDILVRHLPKTEAHW